MILHVFYKFNSFPNVEVYSTMSLKVTHNFTPAIMFDCSAESYCSAPVLQADDLKVVRPVRADDLNLENRAADDLKADGLNPLGSGRSLIGRRATLI